MSASASFLPYAIQCAELAARRESTRVRQRLQRRLTSLASTASTATFIGFLGTVLGIMNCFRSYTGPKSGMIGDTARRISEALLLGLLGLFVAVLAFWFYQYLRGRLEAFNLEMESTTADLVNRLIVHLEGLRITDPPLWSVLSRRPTRGAVPHSQNAPHFMLVQTYRHGLLQLIWPKFTCDLDRTVVREAASWFCAAYGILGNLLYWAQHQRLNGLILLAFFLCAAAMIRNGQPRVAVVCVIAFFAIALVAYGSFCLMLAPLPLLGSFQAGEIQENE